MSKRTALYESIMKYSPKMTDFAGWELPLYFKGIIPEHINVRKNAGLFDVSHMGKIYFRYSDSVLPLFTLNIKNIPVHKAKYTMMLNDSGFIIDDMIIYRLSQNEFFLVPNASTVKRIDERLRNIGNIETEEITESIVIMSIQGPKSKELIERIFGSVNLKFYEFEFFKSPFNDSSDNLLFENNTVLISRTGYTGELGYEIYAPNSIAEKLFDLVMEKGKSSNLELTGLGARDTLRLEKGYLLSGSDFHEDKTPAEANIMKFVDLEHQFIGKDGVMHVLAGEYTSITPFIMENSGSIPRHSYEVFYNKAKVGNITSGTISPMLQKGIALGYIPRKMAKKDTKMQISIHGKLENCIVTTLPFV